ncbi:response regulator transcription factor [Porphyromonas pogonae]|uniref:response regulator transcription factor RprY n=1 Tax=Porphyromonas pogonae TaxID=867595 RepID=UPI002E77B85F|nr:response regulator transcription factor [Porphyromonas pogonae]
MDEQIRIFFCEDDDSLGLLLKEFLETKNFIVDLFPDGEQGFEGFPHNQYDLCILDVMMPKMDGFTLAKEIRNIDPKVPIIFLTARGMKEDVLEGFRAGADDYMSKPFSMEELLLRVEAIMRRINGRKEDQQAYYRIGMYTFDTLNQTLSLGDKTIKLTTKESELLILLCTHANQTLERNYALKTIWVDDNYFNARSMDVYVTKLRKLLKDDPNIAIKNVHGKGYKLVIPPESEEENNISGDL